MSWKKSKEDTLKAKADSFQISKTKCIRLDEPYIYFNHSCHQNTGFRGKTEMIAIKNIKPGEENTYDYSPVFWDDLWTKKYGPRTMKCKCKEKTAGIGDFLTLPKSIRAKYIKAGLLPDFIIQKINEGIG